MILRNCDMNTFSKRTKNKKIACYGIGREFMRMVKSYSTYDWFDSIEFLVDGSKEKEAEILKLNDKEYSICSLDKLKSNLLSDIIILVTCMSYVDVVKKLNAISEFDEAECYLFHFMFSLCEDNSITIRRTESQLIPKVLHYCWFGQKNMPDLYKRCIESWRKYCPDYEIKEWNENNCNIDEIMYTKEAYSVSKYGFVPDYFRLKIIYENGGVYLDTDVELLRNIDDLLYNKAFCGLEFPGEAALGLGFGAQKEHPIIKYLMNRYNNMTFLNKDGSLNEVASPVFQSEDLHNLGMTYENKLQEIEDMTIYPVSVLSPQNVYTGTTSLSAVSYMWHHFDGSWVSGERLKKKNIRLAEANYIESLINESENH